MRTSSIFRSRWMALLWAAGIVWTAVDFAGGATGGAGNSDGGGDNGAASAAEIQQAQALLNSFGQ